MGSAQTLFCSAEEGAKRRQQAGVGGVDALDLHQEPGSAAENAAANVTQDLGIRPGLLLKGRELADPRPARVVMARNESGCWPSFFFLLRPVCGLAPGGVRFHSTSSMPSGFRPRRVLIAAADYVVTRPLLCSECLAGCHSMCHPPNPSHTGFAHGRMP